MAGKEVTPYSDPPITTAVTTVPTGTMKPQAHGGALRHGGTNKGGPGKPSNKLKATWQKMLEKQIVDDSVMTILGNPEHPQFTALYTKLSIMVVGLPGRQEDADDDAAIPHVHMDL